MSKLTGFSFNANRCAKVSRSVNGGGYMSPKKRKAFGATRPAGHGKLALDTLAAAEARFVETTVLFARAAAKEGFRLDSLAVAKGFARVLSTAPAGIPASLVEAARLWAKARLRVHYALTAIHGKVSQ